MGHTITTIRLTDALHYYARSHNINISGLVTNALTELSGQQNKPLKQQLSEIEAEIKTLNTKISIKTAIKKDILAEIKRKKSEKREKKTVLRKKKGECKHCSTTLTIRDLKGEYHGYCRSCWYEGEKYRLFIKKKEKSGGKTK